MAQHTDPSPSKGARRLACPGSYRMERGKPDISGPEAKEGTAAHYLGEICLRHGHQAEQYRGRKIVEVQTGVSMLQEGSTRKKDYWEVTREMVEGVQVYLDVCRSHWPGASQVMIEHRVHIMEGVSGSMDHGALYANGPLFVDDLKYGRIAVDPVGNVQELMYSVGALQASPFPHTDVHCTIIQPRGTDPQIVRSWSIPAREVIQWRDQVLIPGLRACFLPDAPLVAGDHCRYCLALDSCPEANKGKMLAIAELATIPLDNLSPLALSKLLDVVKPVRGLLTLIEEEAKTRLEAGEHIPGWKRVAGRGSRSWENETDAEALLYSQVGEHAYNKKLKTVAQAEGALKDHGLTIDILGPLIKKTPGQGQVVKDTDGRRALPSSAQQAFEHVAPVANPYDIG